MFTLAFVTVALILTIIAIVVSEICLSIENHDLTDQLNEQIRVNKYLAGQILDASSANTTTILPPQE